MEIVVKHAMKVFGAHYAKYSKNYVRYPKGEIQ